MCAVVGRYISANSVSRLYAMLSTASCLSAVALQLCSSLRDRDSYSNKLEDIRLDESVFGFDKCIRDARV